MKTEEREVIVKKTVTVYIADDGQEFHTEDECKEHEFDCVRDSIRCYDLDFNKSTIPECTYVNLISEQDVKNFIYVCGVIGVVDDGIGKPGIYMFVGEDGQSWVNLDEVISHIRGGAEE